MTPIKVGYTPREGFVPLIYDGRSYGYVEEDIAPAVISYLDECVEADRKKLISDLTEFDRRIVFEMAHLWEMMVNEANFGLIHIEYRHVDMDQYDYVCRRIKSGEAFGPELKDLRLMKGIADIVLDQIAVHNAVEKSDSDRAYKIMSKHLAPKTEDRRSKARKKAAEVV